MFKNSIFVLLSAVIAFTFVACSDIEDKLQGEWQVIPGNTISLDANSEIVKGRKDAYRTQLTQKVITFIFDKNELVAKQNGKIVETTNFKIKNKEKDKVIFDNDILVEFLSDNTAIIDVAEDARFEEYYIRKKE